jgi:hypothetical protein
MTNMDVTELQIGLIGMGEVSRHHTTALRYGVLGILSRDPDPSTLQMGRMYARRLAAGGMKR